MPDDRIVGVKLAVDPFVGLGNFDHPVNVRVGLQMRAVNPGRVADQAEDGQLRPDDRADLYPLRQKVLGEQVDFALGGLGL